MGVTKNDSTLLFYGKTQGVSYKKTLMLGRLNLFATKKDIQQNIDKFHSNEKNIADVDFPDEYAEPLFKILGADTVDSMDVSDFEKATLLHDMNKPIGNELKNRFTCVVDGGTLEHVFNFPVAIKNCMEMLEVGGHYIGFAPTNNEMGHGFYQFSPELWYRVLSAENGFEMKAMFITLKHNDGRFNWYEVADPAKVNGRVTLVNNHPLFILLIAKKVAEKEIFARTPQQVDYVDQWDSGETLTEKMMPKGQSKVKGLYKKLPESIQRVFRNVYDLYRLDKNNRDGLGTINPKHFKKVEM